MNATFNLIDRPWVLAQRHDGTTEAISLLDLFTHSDDVARIVGDLPTQALPVLRLALAVAHRAIDGPADVDDWGDLWDDRRLPVEPIASYLERWRHRFDLLHPETPFYQVADLQTKRAETRLSAFLTDIPTGRPQYAMRAAEGLRRIDFAEAARWTLHCHAFDLSGIKGAAAGDPRAKGGKSYPIGPGSLGRVGGVYPEGGNLTETLLLNLIPYEAFGDAVEGDLPVWERDPHGPAPEERTPEGAPHGPLDLYTWQSRRLRLVVDDDGVTGAIICQGDKLELRNQFAREPMSAWRRSQTQEKKLKLGQVYLPRRHDPTRSVWRGFAATLPAVAEGRGGASIAPLVTRHLATAQTMGRLDRSHPVKYHVTGVDYGTQEAVVTDVVDDRLSVVAAVFDTANPELATTVLNAVKDAERAVAALAGLARDLARAAGGKEGVVTGAGDKAAEAGYAALDTAYRDWLAGLPADADGDEVRSRWHRRARTIVSDLGARLAASAGTAAWKGRDDGDYYVSAPTAMNTFSRRLAKDLPLAYPDQDDDKDSD